MKTPKTTESEEFYKKAKEMENIILKIKFRGIDDWNRPIYRVVDKPIYYGGLDTLFSLDATKEQVDDYFKNNLGELEYFGNYFGCEPNGGRSSRLILVLEDTKE